MNSCGKVQVENGVFKPMKFAMSFTTRCSYKALRATPPNFVGALYVSENLLYSGSLS